MAQDLRIRAQTVASVHTSVPALEADIRNWIKNWNDDPKPFA